MSGRRRHGGTTRLATGPKNGFTAVAEFDPDKIKMEAFRDNPRLARVRRYCEENPTARISLVDAARVANLEASYFSSFFHERTGVCFHSWLNYTRVLRAMHSLADTDLSITNVSRKVGFRDLRTFQRAFKRFAGVTPTDYRKQARAEQAERDARVPVNASPRVAAASAAAPHGTGNGASVAAARSGGTPQPAPSRTYATAAGPAGHHPAPGRGREAAAGPPHPGDRGAQVVGADARLRSSDSIR